MDVERPNTLNATLTARVKTTIETTRKLSPSWRTVIVEWLIGFLAFESIIMGLARNAESFCRLNAFASNRNKQNTGMTNDSIRKASCFVDKKKNLFGRVALFPFAVDRIRNNKLHCSEPRYILLISINCRVTAHLSNGRAKTNGRVWPRVGHF